LVVNAEWRELQREVSDDSDCCLNTNLAAKSAKARFENIDELGILELHS